MQIDNDCDNRLNGHSVLILNLRRAVDDVIQQSDNQVAAALRSCGCRVEIVHLHSKQLFSQQAPVRTFIDRILGRVRHLQSVWTAIRSHEVIHVGIEMNRPSVFVTIGLLFAAGFLGKRTVLSLTAVNGNSLRGIRGYSVSRMIRLAGTIVVGSSAAAKDLTSVKSPISVIPLASIDTHSVDSTGKTAIQPRIGVVAPIDRYSLSMLLRAIALAKQKYPRAELVILADPATSLKLGVSFADLKRHGAEVVVCRTHAQTTQELQSCDIYFHHSPQLDPSSYLINSFVRGIPVISSDTSGTADLIAHGKSGLVIETGNHIALANYICKLVESPELVSALSRNGQLLATEFGDATVSSAWLELYATAFAPGFRRLADPVVAPHLQPAVKS